MLMNTTREYCNYYNDDDDDDDDFVMLYIFARNTILSSVVLQNFEKFVGWLGWILPPVPDVL